MKNIKWILAITVFLSFSTKGYSQTANVVSNEQTGWKKIALTTVNFNETVKEMLIAGKEAYRSIYFRVAAGQVNILSLEVFFENGNKQDFAVNEVVKLNTNTKELDLTGDERIVRKIVIKYAAVPNADDKEARLELWASQQKNIR
jgi:hypothetical protein